MIAEKDRWSKRILKIVDVVDKVVDCLISICLDWEIELGLDGCDLGCECGMFGVLGEEDRENVGSV